MVKFLNSGGLIMSSSSIDWNKFGDYAGLATQGIGVIGQVAGAFYSARSIRRNAELQAFMAEMNAKNSERQAQNVFLQRDKQIAALGIKSGRLKSSQRVALAANGVDLSSENAVELLADTELMKEVDKSQIEQNAVAEAWGYRLQGVQHQNQALFARAQKAGVSPLLATHNTLLTGASQVAENWYNLKKQGAFQSKPKSDDPIYGLYAMNNGWK